MDHVSAGVALSIPLALSVVTAMDIADTERLDSQERSAGIRSEVFINAQQ